MVTSTYGNVGVKNLFGSGRDVEKIPKIGMERLASYVAFSKSRNIDFAQIND